MFLLWGVYLPSWVVTLFIIHNIMAKKKTQAKKPTTKKQTPRKKKATPKPKPVTYDYTVVHDDGREIGVNDIDSFCREYYLNVQMLWATRKGARENHKGWRIK